MTAGNVGSYQTWVGRRGIIATVLEESVVSSLSALKNT